MKKYLIIVLLLGVAFGAGYYFREYKYEQSSKSIDAYINSLGM